MVDGVLQSLISCKVLKGHETCGLYVDKIITWTFAYKLAFLFTGHLLGKGRLQNPTQSNDRIFYLQPYRVLKAAR